MALASIQARLLAWLIDAVVFAIALTPLNPALYSDRPSGRLFVYLFIPAMLVLFIALVAFDGGPRGATPGKRILRIRVSDAAAPGPIGYRRASLRRLVYLLGGLPLYAGWIWALIDRHRRTWHDLAAHSVVLRAKREGP
jgi:uncharacterized RDD family membrane protein YckC